MVSYFPSKSKGVKFHVFSVEKVAFTKISHLFVVLYVVGAVVAPKQKNETVSENETREETKAEVVKKNEKNGLKNAKP